MITFILKILYKNDLLKKANQGSYYCDPKILFISRIIFDYIPVCGKETDNIKNYCGDWHRFNLFKWQISYLKYKTVNNKTKTEFP